MLVVTQPARLLCLGGSSSRQRALPRHDLAVSSWPARSNRVSSAPNAAVSCSLRAGPSRSTTGAPTSPAGRHGNRSPCEYRTVRHALEAGYSHSCSAVAGARGRSVLLAAVSTSSQLTRKTSVSPAQNAQSSPAARRSRPRSRRRPRSHASRRKRSCQQVSARERRWFSARRANSVVERGGPPFSVPSAVRSRGRVPDASAHPASLGHAPILVQQLPRDRERMGLRPVQMAGRLRLTLTESRARSRGATHRLLPVPQDCRPVWVVALAASPFCRYLPFEAETRCRNRRGVRSSRLLRGRRCESE